jgi:hypothetical protein
MDVAVLTTVFAASMHEQAVLRREPSNDETLLHCDARASCLEEVVEGLLVVEDLLVVEGLLVVEDLLVVDFFAVVIDVRLLAVVEAARSTSPRSASKASLSALPSRPLSSLLSLLAVTVAVTVAWKTDRYVLQTQ